MKFALLTGAGVPAECWLRLKTEARPVRGRRGIARAGVSEQIFPGSLHTAQATVGVQANL